MQNYSGDPAGIAQRGAVEISCPVDGADGLGAATVNTGMQRLADFIAALQANAVMLGGINAGNVHLADGDLSGNDVKASGVSSASVFRTKGPLVESGPRSVLAHLGFYGNVLFDTYVEGAGETATQFVVSNAIFDAGAWRKIDEEAPAIMLRTGMNGFSVRFWPLYETTPFARAVRIGVTGLAFESAINPNSTIPYTNELTAKNVCKAFGSIELGATPAVLQGFNVASVEYEAGSLVKVTLAAPMRTANYVVNVNGCFLGARIVGVYDRTTTAFRVSINNHDGSSLDPSSLGGSELHFTVFGEQ